MKKGIYAWASIIVWLGQYFSIKPLFKTLFVPWHRDQVSATELGLLMRIVLGILIRLIGAVVRLGIIILGLFTIFLFALTLPIFILPLSINVKRLSHRRPLGRDLAFRFTPLLNRFTRDMSYGPETVLIGKEDTYKRLEQVLARGKQNNALLVGEPGMGRTTLLEQLAKRISWGETLPALSYRHVFEVDLEGLTGEVLTKFLTEASLAGNVILVFDNIHNHPEVLDSILPFTDQSNMQIVGVTTVAGYHTVLKNRTDLLQRFEKVDMAEPTDIEVVNLVQATIRSQGVVAEDGVAEEIVKLTNKLVFNVPQPEKSLDIVEELVIGGTKEINIQDVQDLLTAKTGTPAGGISDKERQVLVNLETKLTAKIIGQQAAVGAVAQALKRARSGLADEARPMGTFLFLGPTGVGKTHTAKILNKLYYGQEKDMVRFDMSEFSTSDTADDFIKSLAVAIEEDPFTLVLFDEIEKSTPEVLNLFLQILDEGHLTEATGRKVYFNNTLIVCTSNAGSDLLLSEPNISSDDLLKMLIKKGVFKPEFVNRFDGVVLFKPLSLDSSRQIAKLMLDDFALEVKANKDIELIYEDTLVETLAELAHSSTFGARSIRRALQDTVANYLADLIIKDEIKTGGRVVVPASIIN